MVEPLLLLERTDKHYLGSGSGIIYAPRFPRWLEIPGFWDEVDIYSYPMASLFTVTFARLEGGALGTPLQARQLSRRWTPAELVSRYGLTENLEGQEYRSVVRGGWFLSEWTLTHSGDKPCTLLAVVWTAQDSDGLDCSSVQARSGVVEFQRTLEDRHGKHQVVDVLLEAAGDAVGGSAYLSEGGTVVPSFEVTPFPEKWRNGVDTSVQTAGISPRGILYAAAASRVTLPPDGMAKVTLRALVRPRFGGLSTTGHLADEIRELVPPPAVVSREEPGAGGEPGSASRSAWTAFFERVPELTCSDPCIERYWYYRWYGLQLCGHEGAIGYYAYPGCCEGTGYFHLPISYSAQCHARELRWLSDPARARGVILNFLVHQRESGQLDGRLYLNHLERTDFYFADWGEAVLSVDAVHPDPSFLRAVYRPLALYAEWLDRERDADETGLIDVVDHYETGQEYMSRYMAVSPDADSENWGNLIRLKGVDATVYTYRLQQALAIIAGRLHEFGEAGRWITAADRTADAMRDLMWDAVSGMFSDVDPKTMRRTGVKAAVCFYPYFTDVVGTEHVGGLRTHLLNPTEFWTEYPVPSTSADDPYYSPDAEWKGKRHNCPWNGRVWPMANSHVAEALARAAIEHDASLRVAAAEFIRKFIHMLFNDGDPERPNCYEHYNPETGRPSVYRGFDDYQHSWVNDLIVKYVAGFRPAVGGSFMVDPLPFDLARLRLSRLPFRGRRVDIEIEDTRFRVSVDDERVGESRIGEALEVRL